MVWCHSRVFDWGSVLDGLNEFEQFDNVCSSTIGAVLCQKPARNAIVNSQHVLESMERNAILGTVASVLIVNRLCRPDIASRLKKRERQVKELKGDDGMQERKPD